MPAKDSVQLTCLGKSPPGPNNASLPQHVHSRVRSVNMIETPTRDGRPCALDELGWWLVGTVRKILFSE